MGAEALLEVTLKAEENLGKVFKEGGLQTKELKAQLHGLAQDALKAVIDQSRIAVERTQALAMQQRDLALAMGRPAEEAGVLMQVTDDLGISYETLLSATKKMNMEGLQPSWANIKTLAAEYQRLPPGVERSQFALEKFGRAAGPEMQKLLEKSTGELDAMAESARESALVLSTESVAAAEAYRLSQDGLNDAIDEGYVALGTELIPVLTDMNNLLAENLVPTVRFLAEGFHDAVDAGENLWKIANLLGIQFLQQTGQIDDTTAALAAQVVVNEGLTDAQMDSAAATEAATDRWAGLATQYGETTAATDSQAEATRNNTAATEARIDALARVQEAEAAATQATNDRTVAHLQLAEALRDATAADIARAAIDALQAQLEKGTLSNPEYQASVEQIMLQFGLATPASIAMASAIEQLAFLQATGKISADQHTAALALLKGAAADGTVELDELGLAITAELNPAQEAAQDRADRAAAAFDGEAAAAAAAKGNVDLLISALKAVPAEVVTRLVTERQERQYQAEEDQFRAEGGPVTKGKAYIVGEKRAEVFVPNSDGTIIPSIDQYTGGGGGGGRGGGNVTIVWSPVISLGDRIEFETRVVPMLREALGL